MLEDMYRSRCCTINRVQTKTTLLHFRDTVCSGYFKCDSSVFPTVSEASSCLLLRCYCEQELITPNQDLFFKQCKGRHH